MKGTFLSHSKNLDQSFNQLINLSQIKEWFLGPKGCLEFILLFAC